MMGSRMRRVERTVEKRLAKEYKVLARGGLCGQTVTSAYRDGGAIDSVEYVCDLAQGHEALHHDSYVGRNDNGEALQTWWGGVEGDPRWAEQLAQARAESL